MWLLLLKVFVGLAVLEDLFDPVGVLKGTCAREERDVVPWLPRDCMLRTEVAVMYERVENCPGIGVAIPKWWQIGPRWADNTLVE